MSDVMERTRIRAVREVRNPVYLAFAKVGKGWVKIGAAWRVKSGEVLIRCRLQQFLLIGTFALFWLSRQLAESHKFLTFEIKPHRKVRFIPFPFTKSHYKVIKAYLLPRFDR